MILELKQRSDYLAMYFMGKQNLKLLFEFSSRGSKKKMNLNFKHTLSEK